MKQQILTVSLIALLAANAACTYQRKITGSETHEGLTFHYTRTNTELTDPAGLDEGTDYAYKIVFPDGSVEYTQPEVSKPVALTRKDRRIKNWLKNRETRDETLKRREKESASNKLIVSDSRGD